MRPHEVRFRPEFIEKQQLFRRQPGLRHHPRSPPLGDVRPILLGRSQDFFFKVSFNFFSARQSVPGCNVVPNSNFNSSSVRSGWAAIAA